MYFGRAIVGFCAVVSFSVANVVFNGTAVGTFVVFQGFFDVGSSFGVTDGLALQEENNDIEIGVD